MRTIPKELAVADVFADDSENEQTFYGFSDSEICDHWVSNVSLKCDNISTQTNVPTAAWSLTVGHHLILISINTEELCKIVILEKLILNIIS